MRIGKAWLGAGLVALGWALAAPAGAGTKVQDQPLLQSPDGRLLAAAVQRELLLLDADGKELARFELASPPLEYAFSPDGTRLAVALTAGGLELLGTAAPFGRTSADPAPCSGLAWSPDGRSLSYAVPGSPPGGVSLAVRRFELEGGRSRTLFERSVPLQPGAGLPVHPAGEDPSAPAWSRELPSPRADPAAGALPEPEKPDPAAGKGRPVEEKRPERRGNVRPR